MSLFKGAFNKLWERGISMVNGLEKYCNKEVEFHATLVKDLKRVSSSQAVITVQNVRNEQGELVVDNAYMWCMFVPFRVVLSLFELPIECVIKGTIAPTTVEKNIIGCDYCIRRWSEIQITIGGRVYSIIPSNDKYKVCVFLENGDIRELTPISKYRR